LGYKVILSISVLYNPAVIDMTSNKDDVLLNGLPISRPSITVYRFQLFVGEIPNYNWIRPFTPLDNREISSDQLLGVLV